MKKIVSGFKYVLINVIIVLLLLVLVNWLCGVYLRNTADPPRSELPNYKNDRKHAREIFRDYNNIRYIYEPFVGWNAKPYRGKTTNINNEGLRQSPTNTLATDSTKIVRFFGGSTMWGEGADDGHTIAALYTKRNPDQKVYNHGQLAYNTRQNLDALITLYEKGVKSDIVVFYDGVNDAAFLCPSDVPVPGHRLVPMFRDRLYVSNTKFMWKFFEKVFLEKILLTIRKHSDVDNSKLYNCISDENKAEEIADFLITNWEIAHNLVTKNGGRFIAILQPSAYIGNPKTDYLNLDVELGKNFRQVYEVIKRKIKEKNYPWIYDLSDRFDQDEFIYIDFCHVSANGNKIMANSIDKIFKDK